MFTILLSCHLLSEKSITWTETVYITKVCYRTYIQESFAIGTKFRPALQVHSAITLLLIGGPWGVGYL